MILNEQLQDILLLANGTHNQLYDICPYYRKLCEIQLISSLIQVLPAIVWNYQSKKIEYQLTNNDLTAKPGREKDIGIGNEQNEQERKRYRDF